LSLGLASQHPDHPENEEIWYRLQPRVHMDDGLRIGVIVDDPLRDQIDIEAILRQNGMADTFDVSDRKFWAVERNWPVQVENPHEIDGEELRRAIGEDTVEIAIEQFIELIRTLHPEFVGTDFDRLGNDE
jgi:hypothetical protein